MLFHPPADILMKNYVEIFFSCKLTFSHAFLCCSFLLRNFASCFPSDFLFLMRNAFPHGRKTNFASKSIPPKSSTMWIRRVRKKCQWTMCLLTVIITIAFHCVISTLIISLYSSFSLLFSAPRLSGRMWWAQNTSCLSDVICTNAGLAAHTQISTSANVLIYFSSLVQPQKKLTQHEIHFTKKSNLFLSVIQVIPLFYAPIIFS